MTILLRRALALVGLLFLVTGGAIAQDGLERFEIATANGTRVFMVETMKSDAERAKGLMFRRYLPDDRGMLFDFKSEQPVAMWMKNTYISLDMIFFDRKGRVTHIAENTEPLSERIISSGPPAFAVLEVNAGVAARIGLKIGDRARHPLFGG